MNCIKKTKNYKVVYVTGESGTLKIANVMIMNTK